MSGGSSYLPPSFQVSLEHGLGTLAHHWRMLQDQQLIRPGGSLDQARMALRYVPTSTLKVWSKLWQDHIFQTKKIVMLKSMQLHIYHVHLRCRICPTHQHFIISNIPLTFEYFFPETSWISCVIAFYLIPWRPNFTRRLRPWCLPLTPNVFPSWRRWAETPSWRGPSASSSESWSTIASARRRRRPQPHAVRWRRKRWRGLCAMGKTIRFPSVWVQKELAISEFRSFRDRNGPLVTWADIAIIRVEL